MVTKSWLRVSVVLCAAFINLAASGAAPPRKIALPHEQLIQIPATLEKVQIKPVKLLPLAQRLTLRLQFADAYLGYLPASQTLQVIAEQNVLSYGSDWTKLKVSPHLFHLKRNNWSGFFWAVDTSAGQLHRVTGAAFGSTGGTQTAVPNVTVQVVGGPDNPDGIFLRFADAHLDVPTIVALPNVLRVIASDTVLSDGADWKVKQDTASNWVYHLSETYWKGFSWKVNLRRLLAYRVTDPLDPCTTDEKLQATVYGSPLTIVGAANNYDVFGCTWAAVLRPAEMSYPQTSPLADVPDNEVVGKDIATATTAMAMTKVVIRDAASNAVLGTSPQALFGDYDLRFSNTAATKQVVFEVVKLSDNTVLSRSAAVSLAHGNNHREVLLANIAGEVTSSIPFPTTANTGVFTRVGNEELADISGGFAKFGSAPGNYWRDAPFGGQLDLFGAVTQNFYPTVGDGSYCYKLQVSYPSGTQYQLLPTYITDPLYKTRYIVRSNGQVVAQSKFLGPVNGCYRLTPVSTSPQPGDPADTIAVFWSFPDLLARWNSTGNGLRQVKIELHHMNPDLSVGTDVGLPNNTNNPATLYIDNTPVYISFDKLLISDGLDLLVSQCAVANLTGGKILTVDFTARHDNGFMATYALRAKSNSGVDVWSVSGSYDPATAWVDGHPALFQGRTAAAPEFTKSSADFSAGACAYVLDLTAWARTTNGYGLVNYAWQQKFYYVQP